MGTMITGLRQSIAVALSWMIISELKVGSHNATCMCGLVRNRVEDQAMSNAGSHIN
jgi:hypothetical protein